eukprot:1674521-Amphidinium_carterae.1
MTSSAKKCKDPWKRFGRSNVSQAQKPVTAESSASTSGISASEFCEQVSHESTGRSKVLVEAAQPRSHSDYYRCSKEIANA